MAKNRASNNLGAVIFDFDGTIADSFDVFIEALSEVLKLPRPLTAEKIKELRGLPTREIIKELNVKPWQLPALAIKGRRAVAAKMNNVGVFEGMPMAIDQLHENYRIYILSTNSRPAILDFLTRYKLTGNVTAVYAGSSIFGKDKKLRSLLKKESLSAERCVYVGDETRDVEAARKAGLRCIAVTWGYSSPPALKLLKPDALVIKPADLVKAISALLR